MGVHMGFAGAYRVSGDLYRGYLHMAPVWVP